MRNRKQLILECLFWGKHFAFAIVNPYNPNTIVRSSACCSSKTYLNRSKQQHQQTDNNHSQEQNYEPDNVKHVSYLCILP
jgi:hypothetical protein